MSESYDSIDIKNIDTPVFEPQVNFLYAKKFWISLPAVLRFWFFHSWLSLCSILWFASSTNESFKSKESLRWSKGLWGSLLCRCWFPYSSRQFAFSSNRRDYLRNTLSLLDCSGWRWHLPSFGESDYLLKSIPTVFYCWVWFSFRQFLDFLSLCFGGLPKHGVWVITMISSTAGAKHSSGSLYMEPSFKLYPVVYWVRWRSSSIDTAGLHWLERIRLRRPDLFSIQIESQVVLPLYFTARLILGLRS